MHLNTSQICVCNAISCLLDTESREKTWEFGGNRSVVQRLDKKLKFAIKSEPRLQSFFTFQKFNFEVLKFLQFWLRVILEILIADFLNHLKLQSTSKSLIGPTFTFTRVLLFVVDCMIAEYELIENHWMHTDNRRIKWLSTPSSWHLNLKLTFLIRCSTSTYPFNQVE